MNVNEQRRRVPTMKVLQHRVICVSVCLLIGLLISIAAAVELRQVISREHPAIKQTGNGLFGWC